MNNEVMNVENVEPQKPMTVAKEDFVNNLTDIIYQIWIEDTTHLRNLTAKP